MTSGLLTGEEKVVYAGSGYIDAEKRENAKNFLFELKLNMFSLLSKIFSVLVKLYIGINESSLPN